MFVAEGARKKLLIERKNAFVEAYLEPMLIEAKQIDLSNEEIKQLIDERGNAK